MPFQKGWKGGPGRPKTIGAAKLWSIKQAAREHCPEALARIVKHMNSDDDRVSLAACIAIIERGFGKPEQKVDGEIKHAFALVPQTMQRDEWLQNRGQPLALPPPESDKGKLN
jgi:hypothetical protein